MRTLTIPLQIDRRGQWATTTDPGRILEQQIIDLVSTYRFERAMLPNHGCDLQGFLFAQVEAAHLAVKAGEIKDVLVRGISFGEILNVVGEEVANAPSTVRFGIIYRVFESEEARVVYRTFTGLVDEESLL